MSKDQAILSKIIRSHDSLKSTYRFRERILMQSTVGRFARVNNRELINFCSNDYLGLASHPEIINAFKRGLDNYGVGSGASNLVCGYQSAHARLEHKVAEITQRSRAVLFSSGYLANLALVTSLVSKNDILIEDRLNHASMLDAAILSRATLKRYQHVSLDHFDSLYGQNKKQCKLVITDGVFSMDGDLAPLRGLHESVQKNNTLLAVDDAHGFGVLGKHGGGLLDLSGLSEKEVPLLMVTFGKALGGSGAFIAGNDALIEQIIQKARSYIYTTAMLPAQAEAMIRSLELLAEEKWRREKLEDLNGHYICGLNRLGVSDNSPAAIHPVLIGEDKHALGVAESLSEAGFLVVAIRPPTVPEGSARLRITISANHEREDIDRLLLAMEKIIGNKHG